MGKGVNRLLFAMKREILIDDKNFLSPSPLINCPTGKFVSLIKLMTARYLFGLENLRCYYFQVVVLDTYSNPRDSQQKLVQEEKYFTSPDKEYSQPYTTGEKKIINCRLSISPI